MIFLFPKLWKESRFSNTSTSRFVRLVNGDDYYQTKSGNRLSKWQQVERVFGPVWIATRGPFWEYSTWYMEA